MADDPRLVETGLRDGRAVVTTDGVPPQRIDLPGASIWRLLRLDGPPLDADAGAPEGPPGPLPSGGLSVQMLQLEPREPDEWPAEGGWRQAATLDLTVVVSGQLLLGLEEDEVILGPGDTLVQRGTPHRMRPAGEGPLRALVAHLAPGEGSPLSLTVRPGTDGRSGVRRVVTGLGADGRSRVVHDGEPAFVFRPGASVLTDVWQTGGPVAAVDQGGDADGSWQVEPVGGGVSVGIVELPPGDYTAPANWHTTRTIDIDVLLSGRLELHLPELAPVLLAPGDVVVQRGTHHRWQPVGDEPARMAAIMVALKA